MKKFEGLNTFQVGISRNTMSCEHKKYKTGRRHKLVRRPISESGLVVFWNRSFGDNLKVKDPICVRTDPISRVDIQIEIYI